MQIGVADLIDHHFGDWVKAVGKLGFEPIEVVVDHFLEGSAFRFDVALDHILFD